MMLGMEAYGMDNLLVEMVTYSLPDGRTVSVPWDVCRGSSVITYTLKSGRIVDAVIADAQTVFEKGLR